MKYELIKTENYLLVLSDENIKVGDWYLVNQYGRGLLLCTQPATEKDIKHQRKYDCKIIIAHLPLDGAPYLDGIDVLAPLDESFEGMMQSIVSNDDASKEGFILGWHLCKRTYKYTEKDLRRAIGCGIGLELWKEEEQINNFIQSLNQSKLPIAFECETEQYTVGEMSLLPLGTVNQKPKTITNSEGRTEWVGKYLF